MLISTRGIVLHQIKYSDSSLIVQIYTEALGRKSFMVRGSHNKKSASKYNLFRSLYLVDLVIRVYPNRSIHSIVEIKLAYPYSTIPFDIRKSTVCMFLAEIINKAIKGEEEDSSMFDFLFNGLLLFDSRVENYSNFHLIFLLKLTRYLGFQPEENHSLATQYFDLLNGIFISSFPEHPYYLDRKQSHDFFVLSRLSFEEASTFQMDKSARSSMLEKIVEYYGLHQDSIKNIKSLKVLKDVFG